MEKTHIKTEVFSAQKQVSGKPEQKFFAGGVSAAVWKNVGVRDGKPEEYRTVSFEKRYKDKSGEWKTSGSYHLSDIPKLQLVLNQAFEYCAMKKEEPVV